MDTETPKQKTVTEIGREYLDGKDKMHYFQTGRNDELIKFLYEKKGDFPVLSPALESLIEHMSVIQMLVDNLTDASNLLKYKYGDTTFKPIISREPNNE